MASAMPKSLMPGPPCPVACQPLIDLRPGAVSMQSFVHETRAARVVFGCGARQFLPRELEQLGVRRVLVLTTPEQAELGRQMAAILGDQCVGVYAKAVMHVPAEVAR